MRTIALWLALVFIFVIPWENTVVFEGVGTVSRAIGLVTALVWAAASLKRHEVRRPGLFHAAVAGFVGWSIFTGLWTIDPAASETRILTFVQLAALVIILWDLLRTRVALEAGLQAYVLGAWVSAVSVLVAYGETPPAATEGERFTAAGFNANDVALILVLGLPVAWYLLVHGARRSRPLVVVNGAFLIVATLAVLLTGSRAAIAAILPAFLFALTTLPRGWHARAAFAGGLALVVAGAASVVPASTFERIQEAPAVVLEGDQGRTEVGEVASRGGVRASIWAEGLEVFFEHPLVGVGAGAFDSTNIEDNAAHNGFLAVMVEQGLVGLTMFLAVCGLAVAHAVRQPPRRRWLWLVVLSGLMTGLLTHNWEMRKQTWLFLGFIAIGAALPGTEQSRRAEPAVRGRRRWRPTSAKIREARQAKAARRRAEFARRATLPVGGDSRS